MRYQPRFPWVVPHHGAGSHALLTRPPLAPKGAFDLHVLGVPPAFVLSQDQTLSLYPAPTHVSQHGSADFQTTARSKVTKSARSKPKPIALQR